VLSVWVKLEPGVVEGVFQEQGGWLAVRSLGNVSECPNEDANLGEDVWLAVKESVQLPVFVGLKGTERYSPEVMGSGPVVFESGKGEVQAMVR